MNDAVIVGAVRTPVGRKDGKLSDVRADSLFAHCLKGLAERTGIDPGSVDDVVAGCVTAVGEQGANVTRNAVLAAGWPQEVPGTTVNRLCGSGLQSFNFACHTIMAGAADLVVAGGLENMSRVAMGSDVGSFNPDLLDRYDVVNQGISAELIAERWGLTREELDTFSLDSHRKALHAQVEGRFDREILPYRKADGTVVEKDGGPRENTDMEKMASLQPSFKSDGLVTAGSSSQISDGAAALLITSRAKAETLGLKPRARYVASVAVGVDPTLMLTGPIPATRMVLEKAGLALDEIDLIEINEAFAPVVLAWEKEIQPDMGRVNVNGGAIALGHPLGATGSRLMVTCLHELERQDLRYGLVTLCIGFGQAVATIIERL